MSGEEVSGEVSREAEIDALQRMEGGEFGLVNDDYPDPGYFTVLHEGDKIFSASVTDHTNGIADGEIIPNGLFRSYIEDGITWVEEKEVPENVLSEVDRLAR